MPHHKQTAAPQTSLPSIPSLLCVERSALESSCTCPGTSAGKSALAQRAWAGHQWFICINFQFLGKQSGRQNFVKWIITWIFHAYSALISSRMSFVFLTVTSRYLNFSTFSNDKFPNTIDYSILILCYILVARYDHILFLEYNSNPMSLLAFINISVSDIIFKIN